MIVDNVVPIVTVTGPDRIQPDEPYILTVETIADPGDDEVLQIVIDWGDGPPQIIELDDLPPDGRIPHTFPPGPRTVTIRIDLVDEDGTHTNTASIDLIIDAVGNEPMIDQFDTTASIPGDVLPSELVTATAHFTDPGSPEIHTAIIDWGDGSDPETAEVNQIDNSGIITDTHRYSDGGIYVVTLTLTDEAGNSVTKQTRAYVTGIRRAVNVVQIVGSPGNDIVVVTPEGQSEIFVSITTPRTGNVRRSFARSEVQGIDVFVGAGNDRVMVSERLELESYMDGGPDNDHIQGGDGANILLGGPGTDRILGGDARDILVGGEQHNLLLAYGGDDVLAGGIWQHPLDQRPDLFNIWSSNEPLANRQAMIAQLIEITADADADLLFGGAGENLYYASQFDLVEKNALHEQVTIEEALELGWATPHEQWEGIFTVVVVAELSSSADPSFLAISDEEISPLANQAESEPNPNPLDVNGDGSISPLDVVLVIEALNERAPEQSLGSSWYLDTNRDGWITALDALHVVNFLNSLTVKVEGEASEPAGDVPNPIARENLVLREPEIIVKKIDFVALTLVDDTRRRRSERRADCRRNRGHRVRRGRDDSSRRLMPALPMHS